ncbi:NOL1/NOP2/sun family putative RNA methylase [Lachnospiraceae bacterium]|nr:NOL1/NOP2/sun family putative RNA methylase [Lachnospiraceae bacterium]
MNVVNEKCILPEEFCKRMRRLMGEEAEEFFRSYEKERVYGLRYNPLKFESREIFERKLSAAAGWELAPVPWCLEGYYYQPSDQPGKHPWHEAGAYYIQEPSAMSAVELLDAKPGEKILDLCAAPGGKTTQIAGKMQGQGLLVSNECYANRARILAQNVERMGICNAVVLNESTEHLAQGFFAFFDRILVDAPCSGEGMFRKDPKAAREWSLEHVEQCAVRQHEILSHAAEMLRPGGVLVYSTCTFAPQENEECLAWFLKKYPQFSLEKVDLAEQYFSSGGVPAKIQRELGKTYRLWPHKLSGEGHFAARLVKADVCGEKERMVAAGLSGRAKKERKTGNKGEDARRKEALRFFQEFEEQALQLKMEEQGQRYVLFSEQLYLLPEEMPPLDGFKVVRAGLHLGTCKKNRFEPSHALALYLHSRQARQYVELTEGEPLKYLHGETVSCGGQKGWTLVGTAGLPLGWGKAQNGIVKNHYPKGLRICY